MKSQPFVIATFYLNFYIVCMILFMAYTHNSYSEESSAIRLASGEYPPFTGKHLPNQGLVSKIVKEVFQLSHDNKNTKIIFEPWRRVRQNTINLKYYASFPFFKNTEREQEFYFSEPIIVVENILFSSFNKKDNVLDLKNKSICLPLGYAKGKLKPLISQYNLILHRPESMTQCFRMLIRERVDYVVASKVVGKYIVATHEELSPEKIQVTDTVIDRVPIHLVSSKKGGSQRIETFNHQLNELMQSGQYEKIIHQYYRDIGIN